jgi:Sec-independent protein translocase protein TatA
MDIWVVLVIILVAVIVWRGPKTLPQLGRAFGRGVREAREEAAKAQAEIQTRTTTDPDERGETAIAAAPVGTTNPPPTAAPTAPPATPPTAAPTAPPATPPTPPAAPTDPTPPSAS